MGTHSLIHKFIKSVKEKPKVFFTDFIYIFVGFFIITPLLLLYFVITLPFMVYHALIAFILSKWYRNYHGYTNMVSPGFTTAYAIEYLCSVRKAKPSKNTILIIQVLEGHVPIHICKERLQTGWVNSKTDENLWKNPELRSYIDSWMGYCYWREDPQFNLNSHVHYHTTEKSEDVDNFTSNIYEKLMNTPFLPQRSPWDLHIIHGWKHDWSPSENNKTPLTTSSPERTVFIIRTHHVIGDGYSFVYLILRDLFGICMKDFEKQLSKSVDKKAFSTTPNLIAVILAFTKLMWDFGSIAFFVLWKAKTNSKLHVKETQDLHYVHHMSSSLISMNNVKSIAKRFGVSFSGVLFSSMTAAIAKSLGKNRSEKFLLVAPRPLPGHPTDRMVNHMTGAAYNVPVKLDMHPIQRLIECDKTFKMVNKSLFPTHVFPLLVHFLSYHIAPVAKFGFKGRQYGASFSNNMAYSVPVRAFDNKYRLLEYSGALSTYDGATGVVICIVSYADGFRFHGVANSDALSKQELQIFIKHMEAEINGLTEV